MNQSSEPAVQLPNAGEHSNAKTAAETFMDEAIPIFAAPVMTPQKNRRALKRKLITFCLILLLIAGGVGALYLLIRVRHVNVLVSAQPKKQPSNTNTQNAKSSENGLSAEAINIARQALGTDAAPGASPLPLPTASPLAPGEVSMSPVTGTEASPVYQMAPSVSTEPSENVRSANTQANHSTSASSASTETPSSRANTSQTIFVEDEATTIIRTPAQQTITTPIQTPLKNLKPQKTEPTAVLPPFGTMLPVRSQGLIFTVRNGSYARLELTRDVGGSSWSLAQGTILVGRVSGSEYDRAFVKVFGFIDPHDNRLVKMGGELLGSDGASGIKGKRVAVNQSNLKRTLQRVGSTGLQVAGSMAGALTGRGTVVIDTAGYRLMNPLTKSLTARLGGAEEKRSLVKVEAGSVGYVMVVDLPKSEQSVDATGDEDVATLDRSLTDREVMELIVLGTPEDIRMALPLMSESQKRLALSSIP